MKAPIEEFEQRKGDHIRLALSSQSQTEHLSGLNQIKLRHEAFPEINFSEVDIACEAFGRKLNAPFFVSSMTAGHAHSEKLNRLLAKACSEKAWMMGVGSQRRELFDENAGAEWVQIRAEFPDLCLLGNIGLAQLIKTPIEKIQKLVDSLEAQALIVHTNPLQEALQPEGTPEFKHGLNALKNSLQFLSVPVIIKETGCGFSKETIEKLSQIGVQFIDLSGLGGTHWGRIEGARSEPNAKLNLAAQVFADWGISTVDSLLNAQAVLEKPGHQFQIWASGGVRSGLDAAKFIAMGAHKIGIAKPILEAALQSEQDLIRVMSQFEFELKLAMFCCGTVNLKSLQGSQVWQKV